MKIGRIAGILSAIVTIAVATQVRATPILFNTGLGPQDTVDPNYTLTISGVNPLIASAGIKNGALIPNYWQSLPGAQWISPYVEGNTTDPWLTDVEGATYIFQTIVGGTGSGLVSATWITDDEAVMKVNGIKVASRDSWPAGLATFSVNLTVGDKVTFEVFNRPGPAGTYGNPAGLIVATIPDGGMTLSLLGSALLGLQALRRKLSS